MYDKVLNFLNSCKKNSRQQHGFLKGRSTSTAVFNVTKEISSRLSQKLHVASVYLDLSKAFPSVDHQILLQKLEVMGIRGNALAWFQSYLSDRSEFVQINIDKKIFLSKSTVSLVGVPQGSIFRTPTLHLICE